MKWQRGSRLGLVGQVGDPFGPEHRRELAKHAWQAPGRHHRHPSVTTLPQGTRAPWTATTSTRHHTRVRQDDLGGLVGPRTTPHTGWGRGGSGHATAAPKGRAGGGRSTAWSRSRTPHRADHPVVRLARLSQEAQGPVEDHHPCIRSNWLAVRAPLPAVPAARRRHGGSAGTAPGPVRPFLPAAGPPAGPVPAGAESANAAQDAAGSTPLRGGQRSARKRLRVQPAHSTARCWRRLVRQRRFARWTRPRPSGIPELIKPAFFHKAGAVQDSDGV